MKFLPHPTWKKKVFSEHLFWDNNSSSVRKASIFLRSLEPGSPASGIYCLMIWGGADVIKIEIKCTINLMCFNHPETIPHANLWKNCLPWIWSLVPKRLGTAALKIFSETLQMEAMVTKRRELWFKNKYACKIRTTLFFRKWCKILG